MLRFPEDSEDLTVGISWKRRKKKSFHHDILRHGEEEVCIASSARWDTQLKGLVELERCCQDMMQEVKLLSERQEVLIGMVVSKRDMQKEAPKSTMNRSSRR